MKFIIGFVLIVILLGFLVLVAYPLFSLLHNGPLGDEIYWIIGFIVAFIILKLLKK